MNRPTRHPSARIEPPGPDVRETPKRAVPADSPQAGAVPGRTGRACNPKDGLLAGARGLTFDGWDLPRFQYLLAATQILLDHLRRERVQEPGHG